MLAGLVLAALDLGGAGGRGVHPKGGHDLGLGRTQRVGPGFAPFAHLGQADHEEKATPPQRLLHQVVEGAEGHVGPLGVPAQVDPLGHPFDDGGRIYGLAQAEEHRLGAQAHEHGPRAGMQAQLGRS